MIVGATLLNGATESQFMFNFRNMTYVPPVFVATFELVSKGRGSLCKSESGTAPPTSGNPHFTPLLSPSPYILTTGLRRQHIRAARL